MINRIIRLGEVCEHGRLKRSCDTCELIKAEIRAVTEAAVRAVAGGAHA